MKTKTNTTAKPAAPKPATKQKEEPKPLVFANFPNTAEAIIAKAGLDPKTVIIQTSRKQVEGTDDWVNDPEAWGKLREHDGMVYCTNMPEQRLGKPVTVVPCFPEDAGSEDLGDSAFARKIAKEANDAAWETLRDPKTPSDVILGSMKTPTRVIGCKLTRKKQKIFNICVAEIRSHGGTCEEALDVLLTAIGAK